MIKKLKNIPVDMNGEPSAVWLKINELVDKVNDLTTNLDGQARTLIEQQDKIAILEEHAHPTATTEPAESNLKCPFCGEKIEHIEDGWCNCKNRCTGSGSIELWLQFLRTRKALEIAVDALKWIHETYNLGMGYEAAIMEKCDFALEQITALEQKDIK